MRNQNLIRAIYASGLLSMVLLLKLMIKIQKQLDATDLVAAHSFNYLMENGEVFIYGTEK